jgi:hypothetical protein
LGTNPTKSTTTLKKLALVNRKMAKKPGAKRTRKMRNLPEELRKNSQLSLQKGKLLILTAKTSIQT